MGAKFTIAVIITGFLISSCVATIGPEGPPGRDGVVEIYNGTFIIDSDIDFGRVDEFISIASYSWEMLNVQTVDEGVVVAYIRFNGSTSWQSLPLSTPFQDDVVILRYGFDINNFDLIIEGEIANNNQANERLFDGDEIRVIAIPPSLLFKGKGVDYNNYEMVKKVYGLID